MMRSFKQAISYLLVFALLFTFIQFYEGFEVTATDSHATQEYQIYPKPHEVSYSETSSFELTQNISLSFGTGIDQATRNKAKEILSLKGLTESNSYILKAQDGTIAILGKDTDTAFYGLATLKIIIKQLEEMSFRSVLIKDYGLSTVN